MCLREIVDTGASEDFSSVLVIREEIFIIIIVIMRLNMIWLRLLVSWMCVTSVVARLLY